MRTEEDQWPPSQTPKVTRRENWIAAAVGVLIMVVYITYVVGWGQAGYDPSEVVDQEMDDRTRHDSSMYDQYQQTCADPYSPAVEEFCAGLKSRLFND